MKENVRRLIEAIINNIPPPQRCHLLGNFKTIEVKPIVAIKEKTLMIKRLTNPLVIVAAMKIFTNTVFMM